MKTRKNAECITSRQGMNLCMLDFESCNRDQCRRSSNLSAQAPTPKSLQMWNLVAGTQTKLHSNSLLEH